MIAPSPTMHAPSSRAEWLEIRRRFFTASDSPALLGVHPYRTLFDVWCEKTGRLDSDADDDAPQLERGRLMEPIAIAKLRKARPAWTVEANEIGAGGCIIVDESSRMAATLDTFVIDPERGRGTVQIKSVEPFAFRRSWAAEGEPQPPIHVAVQTTTEAHLARLPWAAAAALVVGHGIDLHVLDVPLVPALVTRLEDAVGEFWRLVETDTPPAPLDYDRDGDLLRKFGPAGEKGLVRDFHDDAEFCAAAHRYRELTKAKRAAEKEHYRLGNVLRDRMGEAEVGLVDGLRITLKLRNRPGFTVPPKSGRELSVRDRKHQEDNDDE